MKRCGFEFIIIKIPSWIKHNFYRFNTKKIKDWYFNGTIQVSPHNLYIFDIYWFYIQISEKKHGSTYKNTSRRLNLEIFIISCIIPRKNNLNISVGNKNQSLIKKRVRKILYKRILLLVINIIYFLLSKVSIKISQNQSSSPSFLEISKKKSGSSLIFLKKDLKGSLIL